MEEFMLAKVQRTSLPHVSTPFLVDSSVDDGVGGPKGGNSDDIINAFGDLLDVATASGGHDGP
eukprot:12924281-Prorocentrum_lima.AAC.1